MLRRVRPVDRLLLRSERLGWRAMPGVVEALVSVTTGAGVVLLLVFVVRQLAGLGVLPFVLGPVLALIRSPWSRNGKMKLTP